MSYQVLARKWRPKDFNELIGQQQTSQALSNALESQRLHHAYLFTGTRGVGKTTIARILSKSLNCEKGISSTPCGECSSCIEITQGNFVDLLEIDAASKTKVEDTRELLDNVQYRPTRGRYKVYLIDEVHMLSGHSFNALLKTLEEPPPHVIFLLATTDPQKMPVTVLSRCLQFHLRRMEESDIIAHLTKILQAEQIEVEEGALQPIAKGADGSMRDALSLLDQAIAYCGGEVIQKKVVLDMLGSIDRAYSFRLIEAICDGDAQKLMQIVDDINQYSPDYHELLTDWLSLLHQIAVSQATSVSDDEQVKVLAQTISAADLQLFYQLSLHAKRDLAYAPHPRQGFEMAMLRIMSFKPQTSPQTPVGSAKKNSSSLSKKNKVPQVENNLEKKTLNQVTTDMKASAIVGTASSVVIENKANSIANLQHSALQETTIADNSILIEKVKPQLSVVDNHQTSQPAFKQTKTQPLLKEKTPVRESSTLAAVVVDKNTVKISATENYVKISLNHVNSENWFNIVGLLTIEGNGLQVLLNSTASFSNNRLKIDYLSKVSTLLTENALQSIKSDLKQYFENNQLMIELNSIEKTSETPKERMTRLHGLAIDKAHQKLLSDPQVNYLLDKLDATLSKDTIKLIN